MAPNDEAEIRARAKEAGRENRLSFRNRAEQLLRRECKEEAMEKCSPYVKEFAECAREQGLFVVFKCRKHLKNMNGCMEEHNGEAAWQRYKEAHKDELEKRARGEKIV